MIDYYLLRFNLYASSAVVRIDSEHTSSLSCLVYRCWYSEEGCVTCISLGQWLNFRPIWGVSMQKVRSRVWFSKALTVASSCTFRMSQKGLKYHLITHHIIGKFHLIWKSRKDYWPTYVLPGNHRCCRTSIIHTKECIKKGRWVEETTNHLNHTINNTVPYQPTCRQLRVSTSLQFPLYTFCRPLKDLHRHHPFPSLPFPSPPLPSAHQQVKLIDSFGLQSNCKGCN